MIFFFFLGFSTDCVVLTTTFDAPLPRTVTGSEIATVVGVVEILVVSVVFPKRSVDFVTVVYSTISEPRIGVTTVGARTSVVTTF